MELELPNGIWTRIQYDTDLDADPAACLAMQEGAAEETRPLKRRAKRRAKEFGKGMGRKFGRPGGAIENHGVDPQQYQLLRKNIRDKVSECADYNPASSMKKKGGHEDW